jgi:Mrp family chromosome partitioning ATPase
MNPLGFLKNTQKQMTRMNPPAATIIPIASGKGGVGKSFVSSNLAIALAQKGHRVIAVDLDFGGANLHSFLGLANRYPGIGDFLQARIAQRIEKFWNQPVKDSASLLINSVIRDSETRSTSGAAA